MERCSSSRVMEDPTYGSLPVHTTKSVDIEVNKTDLYVDRDWMICVECGCSCILMEDRPPTTTVRRCPYCGTSAKAV
jgi:hypothetical protein